MTSSTGVKQSGYGTSVNSQIGYLLNMSNNLQECAMGVGLFSQCSSKGHGLSIVPENFLKCTALFTARKSVKSNWLNSKDEYLAPNESHPDYKQFEIDSIVYSLFNDSSQQSSLRQITYKEKLWDIKNEFFWMSKSEIKDLAEKYYFDEVYSDCKNQDERFVFNKLQTVKDQLSDDAKDILNQATQLLINSFKMRKLYSETNPKLHLNSFDAGYAQLKGLWKEYFPTEFRKFRDDYKKFSERMKELVYEVGFLRR